MRRVLSGVSRSVAVLAVLVGGADRAGAGPLNPVDFSLSGSGVFPTAAGTFTFDTRNLTLTGPGITTPIQGSLSTTGVAVFDFNAITMASDQVFVSQNPFSNVTTPPLALLSRGDITINGTIDVSAPPFIRGVSNNGAPGGPGGFGSDRGPGGGGGGGRVLIQVEPGGFTSDVGSINVSGGPGTDSSPLSSGPFSGGGAPGVLTITVVPEPASLVLLGIGLLAVLGYAGRRSAT